ncbi:sugar ABC transporter substrate-binding protein [Paenibacillus crassostreae]|uniref:Sugar ABC transporter substrate-binding protein n=1 Tax=Paenibacillus crassostreae TaxID=1763538 RepID=A0A167EVX7_9BACL|nr:sugar ABC transporter substrate-binding protein [Paenibacillus crassostreae]AOZ93416.1 sugar ABC transporter substrate-binding protein [Paenibacillus crassostreae]OAB75930.1 sugar ABC transporter substrate-binding protein [Paenibacillus crassostreae]
MNKFSKVAFMVMLVLMVVLTACSSSGNEGASKNESLTPSANTDSKDETGAASDYTFGEDQTFHSNEAVSYSMMYSDHENYPYKEDWRLWSAIQEKTNVTFDLSTTARTEYENQKSLLVNSGDAPYIIPKTYDESAFVASGQIVSVSDWVQYMPNYMKAVKDWGMEEDLKAKLKEDGKYYVLPGMWEVAGGGYSYIIRKDVFEAAGVDVEGQQANWTYDDFAAAMKQVKDFTGKPYVFSDQFKGDSTLNIAAVQYGVTAGWGVSNGMVFDHEKQQFTFANGSDDFKNYLGYFNKLVNDGIMDPESFTQEDDVAQAKFFKGDSYVINSNYQLLSDFKSKMQEPNSELYMITVPGGPKGMSQVETSRLENGIMISQNALDDLGEEEFIKMLRFVDWFWYSNEGQTLSLWGVEGETYTKDAEGNIVLNSDIYFNGLNEGATKQLNVDYGFGNGMFAYGGNAELKMSKMSEGERDYVNRIQTTREPRKLQPPIMATPEETEQMNLIATPLIDYVKTMTLKFITGQESFEKWNEYTAQVEANGSTRFTDMANDIFQKTKSLLGY